MKFLIAILFMTLAHAGDISSFHCSRELSPLAKEWSATGDWEKQYQNGLKDFFLASPTDTVGEWVVAKDLPNGAVISKISQRGRIETVFDGASCKKKISVYQGEPIKKELKSDKELSQFIGTHKTGVLYVWSPRMPLSEKGILEIKAAAKELKLPLMIFLDKEVTENEVSALKKKLPGGTTDRIDSLEFKMRNVGQHFPALLVFKDKKIRSGVKYGFEKSSRYVSDINELLSNRKE